MGWGELLWWRVSEAGSTNGVMVLEIEGRLDIERLRHAMAQVSLIHPLLRARAVRDGSGGRFEVLADGVCPLRVVQRRDNQHWIEIAEEETNRAVPPDAYPLWRLVAVRGESQTELVFVVNHSIVDGISGNLFYDPLLRIYAGEPTMAPRPLPPAFDGVVKHGGALAVARYMWTYLRNQVGQAPTVRLPLAKGVSHTTPGRTRLIDFTLDEATTAALSKQCKSQKATLNGLLSAAMLMATSTEIESAAPHRIGMSFAMNLRPLLKVDVLNDFGYYVTGTEAVHTVAPDADPWALARSTMQDTTRAFHGEHVKVFSLFRQVILKFKTTGQSLLDAAPKSSKSCFHITNMGRSDMPTQYGDLRVRRWFHTSSAHLVRHPFICLSSIAYAGRLQLTFGYCEPHTDRVLVDRVVARFMDTLQRAAQGQL
jgi:NRPS condensation-like uncharacterized protein